MQFLARSALALSALVALATASPVVDIRSLGVNAKTYTNGLATSPAVIAPNATIIDLNESGLEKRGVRDFSILFEKHIDFVLSLRPETFISAYEILYYI